METKETELRLLPKGLILLALGGFGDRTAMKNAEAVVSTLTEFMKRNNLVIAVIEDGLDFIPIKNYEQLN